MRLSYSIPSRVSVGLSILITFYSLAKISNIDALSMLISMLLYASFFIWVTLMQGND